MVISTPFVNDFNQITGMSVYEITSSFYYEFLIAVKTIMTNIFG